MAITIDPLTDVIRNTAFSQIVTASGNAGETVVSIAVAFQSTNYGGVSITTDTISGSYDDLFQDITESVSKGSSDRLETPLVTTNTNDIPAGRDLYKYKQDQANSKDAIYTVTVTYTPMGGGDDQQHIEDITHTVNNSTSLGLVFLLGYLGL